MDTLGLLVPNLWLLIFRKPKVKNTLMFLRGQSLYLDSPLPVLTQREVICLINDGNAKGSGFLPYFPSWYLRRRCCRGYPTARYSLPWGLPGSFRKAEWCGGHIEFLGWPQSLFHFPCGMDTELRQLVGCQVGGFILDGEMVLLSISSNSWEETESR